jgi:hypothetical protein
MANLEQSWKQVAGLLENAAAILPEEVNGRKANAPEAGQPLSGTLGEFQEFLEQNELELAWDALAAVAKRLKAGAGVWLLLARAATFMGLSRAQKKATRELVKAIKHEEPNNRLVYQRRYRNRQGKIVWQKPPKSPRDQGLKPA